jgi:hypothetical protein
MVQSSSFRKNPSEPFPGWIVDRAGILSGKRTGRGVIFMNHRGLPEDPVRSFRGILSALILSLPLWWLIWAFLSRLLP